MVWTALVLLAAGIPASEAATPPRPVCSRIVVEGEVTAGGEWTAKLGDGWVFRVLPIAPSQAGYSGWDLVVDRDQAAGFPDALLLATMPYNSINEREVGTTFGLRAQDAIGWNPRSFRFISNLADFRESRELFRSLMENSAGPAGTPSGRDRKPAAARAMQRLLELQKRTSSGEFRILDARVVPGIADPAPYAQNWALASSRTPHRIEAASDGKSTARGALNWMRFAVTFYLPAKWNLSEFHAVRTPCPD